MFLSCTTCRRRVSSDLPDEFVMSATVTCGKCSNRRVDKYEIGTDDGVGPSDGLRETAYDARVSPLVKEIVQVCLEADIGLFIHAMLDPQEDGDPRVCTTAVPCSRADLSERSLSLLQGFQGVVRGGDVIEAHGGLPPGLMLLLAVDGDGIHPVGPAPIPFVLGLQERLMGSALKAYADVMGALEDVDPEDQEAVVEALEALAAERLAQAMAGSDPVGDLS